MITFFNNQEEKFFNLQTQAPPPNILNKTLEPSSAEVIDDSDDRYLEALDKITYQIRDLNTLEYSTTSSEIPNFDLLIESFQCPLCKEIAADPGVIKHCLHFFCKNCIETCIRQYKKECPMCKKNMGTKRELRRNRAFENIIKVLSKDIEIYQDNQSALFKEIQMKQLNEMRQLSQISRDRKLIDSQAGSRNGSKKRTLTQRIQGLDMHEEELRRIEREEEAASAMQMQIDEDSTSNSNTNQRSYTSRGSTSQQQRLSNCDTQMKDEFQSMDIDDKQAYELQEQQRIQRKVQRLLEAESGLHQKQMPSKLSQLPSQIIKKQVPDEQTKNAIIHDQKEQTTQLAAKLSADVIPLLSDLQDMLASPEDAKYILAYHKLKQKLFPNPQLQQNGSDNELMDSRLINSSLRMPEKPPKLDLRVKLLFDEDLKTMVFPLVKELIFRVSSDTPFEIAAKLLATRNDHPSLWKFYSFSLMQIVRINGSSDEINYSGDQQSRYEQIDITDLTQKFANYRLDLEKEDFVVFYKINCVYESPFSLDKNNNQNLAQNFVNEEVVVNDN
eukprot:403340560